MSIVSSGRDFEAEMFGVCACPRPYHSLLPSGYFQSSLEAFLDTDQKATHNWNVLSPGTQLGRKFLFGVALKLYSLATHRPDVALHCALGTDLDYSFGVDGVLVARYPSRYWRYVTFDLTRNTDPSKKLNQKARYMIDRHDLMTPASFDSLCLAMAQDLRLHARVSAERPVRHTVCCSA